MIADDDFFLRVGKFTDVIGISAPLASFRTHTGSATGRLESISRTLAHDYLFQVQYHQLHTSILSAEDIRSVHNLAIRFINDFFVESFVDNNAAFYEEAVRFRKEFEKVDPGRFTARSSIIARLLWMMSKKILPGSTVSAMLSIWLRILLFLKKNFSTKT